MLMITLVSTISERSYEYINYWLNDKLEKIENNNLIKAKYFYERLINEDKNFDSGKILERNIHNIEKYNLDNMNILRNLYKFYDNIRNASYFICQSSCERCSNISNKCVDEYNQVISKCSNKENTSFCKALRNFKEKYDNLRDNLEKSSNCKIQNLPEILINKEELSLEDPSGEYELSGEITEESGYSKGAILTGVLSTTFGISLLLLLLYKFTIYGPRLRVPKQRKKITWDNLSEEALILSITEHEQLNSQNSEFNLKYHSLQ
ncbi:PIR Superfamily Protein [Plasmodium ovale wallikeri]|uniref:PIR Superfamily Protein n=1 Tax=Plasmodium ovale wallikeri TaxID=864142 RepID=A0A1A9AHZ8_PLAOA|nr:PIR Superfamily Protein [Plasmodium ovale wallikeri]